MLDRLSLCMSILITIYIHSCSKAKLGVVDFQLLIVHRFLHFIVYVLYILLSSYARLNTASSLYIYILIYDREKYLKNLLATVCFIHEKSSYI